MVFTGCYLIAIHIFSLMICTDICLHNWNIGCLRFLQSFGSDLRILKNSHSSLFGYFKQIDGLVTLFRNGTGTGTRTKWKAKNHVEMFTLVRDRVMDQDLLFSYCARPVPCTAPVPVPCSVTIPWAESECILRAYAIKHHWFRLIH